VDPPISRAALVRVDHIPLSSSSRRFHFHSRRFPAAVELMRSCDRLAPARAPIRPLAPAGHVLVPPPRTALLLCMRVKTLCNIRSNANPSGEIAAEAASIADTQTRVGPVDDD
jgi:hypothetical protein